MKLHETEIMIANIKPFVKQNEDGTQWHANIIDGLIFGVGCITQLIPASKIKGVIKEGSQYPCYLAVVTRNNKLCVEIEIQGEENK